MSQTKAQLLDPKGDVTYSGHITGVGATFSGNLDVTGNVSVGGTLTKQDVTNVDSVGVITARAGIDCTGITSITGADDTDNFVIDVLGGTQFAVHTDASDGEISVRAQDGSGNNYSKYMTFFTQPSGAGAAERLRIDSSGRVLLGTTTLGHSNADDLTVHNSNNCGITIRSGSSNDGNIFFADADSSTIGTLKYDHTNNAFRINTNGAERLRITNQGSVGINSTSPVGTLDVTTTAGTGSTVFIYAANHNTGAASEAELRFGFAHSGSPEGIGYIKLKENGNNVFDGNLVFGVPNNNGSGGSVTNDVLFIKGSTQNVGIGSEIPQAKLDVNGTIINTRNVNSTGDAGIHIASGHRLGFDQSGTRSWTVKATGGNLEIQSGDGNGSLKGASSGGVSDNKGNLRSVPLNTQGSAYTLVANDAGKCILASGNVTFNTSIFGSGDVVTIINNTNGDITITQGSGAALYNTADGTTGNRTLATRGISTIYFTHNTTGYISGTGLS